MLYIGEYLVSIDMRHELMRKLISIFLQTLWPTIAALVLQGNSVHPLQCSTRVSMT